MKINIDKIQKALNFNPTKRSQTMTIAELSEKIEDNTIVLPIYQRNLVWSDNEIIDLFNYQLFGKAPIAPLSFNEIGTNDEVPQLSFINRIELKDKVQYKLSVVDGQQRLTTNYKAYSNDKTFNHIVFDFAQGSFKKSKNISKTQIPVGVLFGKNQQTLVDYIYKKYSINKANELFPLLLGIRTKFFNYSYTIHIAENMTADEQIEWFELLNNAGSKMSEMELTVAKIRVHGFDLYSDFTFPYMELIKRYNLKNIFSDFESKLSYSLSALNPSFEWLQKGQKHNINCAPIPSDTKEKLFLKLNKNQLKAMSELTLDALDNTLSFIADNHLQDKIKTMESVMFLTGYFIFNKNNIQKQELKKWINEFTPKRNSINERRIIYSNLLNSHF